MHSIRLFAKRYPLMMFFAVAYASTWIGWIVPDRIYTGTLLTTMLTVPFLIFIPGPLLAAILVTALIDGKAGVTALLRKFTIWRVGWRWYAVGLLLAPTIGLTAVYVNVYFGAPDPTPMLAATWPSILLMFAVRLVNPMDGPMQEELGWRGFALPRLQERFSPLAANLVLGLLVVGWHLPLVLRGDFPSFALLATMAVTVLFGWLCNNTRGSVLLPLIAHAADGLIRPDLAGADLTRFYALMVAGWCIAAIFVVVRYGPTLMRRSTTQVGFAPTAHPLVVK